MNLSNKLFLFAIISFTFLLSAEKVFFKINLNRNCEELSQDECFETEGCYWRYGECVSFEWEDECQFIDNEEECDLLGCIWSEEGCYRPDDNGVPECLQDCPGVSEINPQENPDETCDWAISILGVVDPGFNSCFNNCDEDTLSHINEILEACYECLQNENIDCSSVFNNHEDGEENEGDYCYSIDSFEECYQIGCEWDEEEGCFDPSDFEEENDIDCETLEEDDCREFEYCIWAESECLFADDNDDGGDFEDCSELTQDECTMSEFCDWTIVTTPNGVFETCIESNDWNDDGGWDDGGNNIVCSDINNPFECIGSGCDWVQDNMSGSGYCIELDDNDCDPDLICGEAVTCFDGLLYPTTCGPENCDLPIGVCDDNGDDGGWNDDGGDFEDCSELTQDECTMSEFCDWTIVTTPNGVFETCIESNDWNDDGGWDDGGNNIVCSDINNPYECIGSGCDWVYDNIPGGGYCIEENNEDCNPDLMCGGAITCVDGLLYPTTCGPDNCDDPIGECEEDECENGEVNNENPCNPFECFDGQWYEIVIDCAEEMGIPCENGEYVDPPEGECCSICVEYNDNADAILFLDSVYAVSNSEVSIPLYVSSNEPVAGLQFEIYSPLNSGGNGGFVNPSSIESMVDCFNTEYNVIDNILIVIMFSLEACIIPDGENHIANINYYIPQVDLGQNIPLEFGDTIVSDQFGNEIPSFGESGSILVGMQGDVNGDGQINVSDIVLAVSFAISSQTPSPYQLWAGDVNDDGMVNVLDIVTIVNMILN